ncbi:MAG: SRPBCC domain-containing protein [Hyphomonadaceae bacterium]|nr:SRPBCC domain-containing protein [Hyphomonadaceae bacterium]
MTTAAVELGPIVKSIDVRRSAADAFHLFTARVSEWWPLETHTRARTAAGEVTVRVTIEPRVGGRVYETLQSGEEREWGEVTTFEPGRKLAMSWRLGRPEDQYTDVSVRFDPVTEASCRVTLTHENWERMDGEAGKLRDAYNGGWATVFDKCFGDFANSRA